MTTMVCRAMLIWTRTIVAVRSCRRWSTAAKCSFARRISSSCDE